MISCSDCLPWKKPGYINMTRRQRNIQWSVGIAAHPVPKIPIAKIRCKYPHLETLGESGRHSPHWLSSKGPNYQRALLLISSCATGGHFEGKTPWEVLRSVSFSCTTMSRHTRHLQFERNWPTWASNALITFLILRMWTHWTLTCSLALKIQLKYRHFLFDAEFIDAAEDLLCGQPPEFFFGYIAKFWATGYEVYAASWRVCWINTEIGRCRLFLAWSG